METSLTPVSPVLLATADEMLLDDLLRLTAAAEVTPQVEMDLLGLRRCWQSAVLVVVGQDFAEPFARTQPVRRPGVVVAAVDADDAEIYRRALSIGAENVFLLPADEAALAAAPGLVLVVSTVFPASLRNAELVLPVTNMAEENGTYVNRDRRVQRFHQAKSQPGMARPAWWIAAEVAGRNEPALGAPSTAAEAFELLGERWPAFAGLSYRDLGYTGRVLAPAGQEAKR